MNVTELARRLKVTPQELREKLPRMGFDIGQKAIKIDDKLAQRIIKEWPRLNRQLEQEDKEKKQAEATVEGVDQEKKEVVIPNYITVNDFSKKSGAPISKILKELMKNGIFASINEKIDHETANIIGDELNLDVKLDENAEEEEEEKNKIEEVLNLEARDKLQGRPPILVVMGHVDHGKTKLLDSIRNTNIAGDESGGITQHIGAYQAVRQDRLITFIDTPGHEAFTAMRSRGAKVADIAILIVAADDGVKPQTVEAYKIIKASQVPFLVAINKIDKEGADVNKTKQELSNKLGIIPEDWGGKTICAPISAYTGEGVQHLLDMVLLLTDTEAKDMKANPDSPAIGTIIESHVDKSAGAVATILIQNGTLKLGDMLCLQNKLCGKVRALQDYQGKNVQQAPPSMPVQITGLKIAPTVGDILEVATDEKGKEKISKLKHKQPESHGSGFQVSKEENEEEIPTLNLVVKSDVLGSAEAIEESLEKINNDRVKVQIIHKGLGNIRESDIQKAEAGNDQIIGFNIKIPPHAEGLIREKNMRVKVFNVIYNLIEYVREEMEKIIQPTIERQDLGKVKVMAIFRTEKDNQIVGGKVIEGKAEKETQVEVLRDKEIVLRGRADKIKRGKEDVNEVEADQECGVEFHGKPEIQEGDILQFYKEKKVSHKLDSYE